MPTIVSICNRTLELIAAQTTITGLNDGTAAGNAFGVLYQPTVEVVLREVDPSFARRTAALSASGVAPPTPWALAYDYPVDCIRLRQVRPALGNYDPNDPLPVRAAVGLIIDPSSVPHKLILTNQTVALAMYTSNLATEAMFDSAFAEAVSRRLGNAVAMALAGRPDFARELLQEAESYSQLAETIDEV